MNIVQIVLGISFILSLIYPVYLVVKGRRQGAESLGRGFSRRLIKYPDRVDSLFRAYLKGDKFLTNRHFAIQVGVGAVGGLSVSLVEGYAGPGFSVGLLSTFGGMFWMVALDNAAMPSVRMESLKYTYQGLVDSGQYQLVDDYLKALFYSGKGDVVQWGIELTGKWGSPSSRRLVQRLAQKGQVHNPQNKPLVDLSRQLNQVNQETFDPKADLGVKDLLLLMDRYDGYYFPFRDASPFTQTDNSLLSQQLKAFFSLQSELEKAPDQAFCERCYRRTETKTIRTTQYQVCPQCHHWDRILPGIETVVGEISNGTEAFRKGAIYQVGVWDERKNEVIPAEIDLLRIPPGGDFNYDWAVAAVAEALRNRFATKEEAWQELELDPEVSLSPNTKAILFGSRP